MALTTLYFSTAGAGSANGTSWANRAPLLSSGAFNTLIASFNYSGGNGLLAYVGPGTYTPTSALNPTGTSVVNPLVLHGCDSSGVALAPAAPYDCSQPLDTTGFPVINTTTNINTVNNANVHCRMISFTGSATSTIIASCASLDRCYVALSLSNSASNPVSACARILNSHVRQSGANYGTVVTLPNNGVLFNTRVEGNPAGVSGNRAGVTVSGSLSLHAISRCLIFNNAATGVLDSGGDYVAITESVVAKNGSHGIILNSSIPSSTRNITRCVVTGNGGYGINLNGQSQTLAAGNRLRHNTSGDFSAVGVNYPTTLGNDTANPYASQSAGDAAEFVDASNGDYRNKRGGYLWGKGWGVADQPGPRTVAYAN